MAPRIGLGATTLRRWRRERKAGRGAPSMRGRKPFGMRGDVARLLIELAETFAEFGAATLHAMVGLVPRRWIEWIVRRRERRRTRTECRSVLEWARPGAVWAMDHSEAGALIDGRSKYLFVVRDLASGMPLAARATASTDAGEVHAELVRLFAAHGPPLVLKSDNGSGLCAEQVTRLLDEFDVTPLRSPPGTPQYNGAVEAGMGSIKRIAARVAERAGRQNTWTSDDVEGALRLIARIGGPRGARRSPRERWAGRRQLAADERSAFLEAAARRRADFADVAPQESPGRANVERAAISRALQDLQYLTIRRPGDSTGR